jgi:hypothetical protein
MLGYSTRENIVRTDERAPEMKVGMTEGLKREAEKERFQSQK